MGGEGRAESEDTRGHVIAEISHDSPPAEITPQEAEQCQRAVWEAHVEAHATERAYRNSPSDFYLLTFGRHPKQFDEALRACWIADNMDVQPAWANGAKVLAPGVTEEVWRESDTGVELRPQHVIINAEHIGDLYDVMKC